MLRAQHSQTPEAREAIREREKEQALLTREEVEAMVNDDRSTWKRTPYLEVGMAGRRQDTEACIRAIRHLRANLVQLDQE